MNKRDLRRFQLFMQFRGKKMTVGGLLIVNARLYLMLVIIFGAIVGYFYHFYNPTIAGYFAVAGVVTILRDISYYRQSASFWPRLQTVLDWAKVEEIISSATRNSA